MTTVLSPELVADQKAQPSRPFWHQREAVALCVIVEMVASQMGCHVALTGGCLYDLGPRKDCDILFYRVRQAGSIDRDALEGKLAQFGLVVEKRFGWMSKAVFCGKTVDLFFPEHDDSIMPDGTPYGGQENAT